MMTTLCLQLFAVEWTDVVRSQASQVPLAARTSTGIPSTTALGLIFQLLYIPTCLTLLSLAVDS
jgi:hypothetical protein